MIGMNIQDVRINISEVRKPELDATWSQKASRSSSSVA